MAAPPTTCPSCGGPVDPAALLCPTCGAELPGGEPGADGTEGSADEPGLSKERAFAERYRVPPPSRRRSRSTGRTREESTASVVGRSTSSRAIGPEFLPEPPSPDGGADPSGPASTQGAYHPAVGDEFAERAGRPDAEPFDEDSTWRNPQSFLLGAGVVAGGLVVVFAIAILLGVGGTGPTGALASPSGDAGGSLGPTGSSSDVPTPADGSPGASPSSGAVAPTGEEVIEAFIRRIADRSLSYHVIWTGRATAPAERHSFRVVLDVVGRDYAGSAVARGTTDFGPGQVVYKDGIYYEKVGRAAWRRRELSDERFQQYPFLGVASASDLRFVGQVSRGGRIQYQLASTASYRPNRERMLWLVLLRPPTDTLSLSLFLLADGTPTSATYRIEAGGTDVKGNPKVLGTASWTFSKVGATLTVRAPK